MQQFLQRLGERIAGLISAEGQEALGDASPRLAEEKLGDSIERSRRGVHSATTKFCDNPVVFKKQIEKEGFPKDSLAGRRRPPVQIRAPRPPELADFLPARYFRNAATWEHLGTIDLQAGSLRLFARDPDLPTRTGNKQTTILIRATSVFSLFILRLAKAAGEGALHEVSTTGRRWRTRNLPIPVDSQAFTREYSLLVVY
jgi:hypothetical protein